MNFIKAHHKLIHGIIILLTIAVNLSFFTGYSKALSQPEFVRKWGTFGTITSSYPLQIAYAPSGDIYVSDANNHIVSVFDTAGTLKFKFGGIGNGDGQFWYPWGITINPTSGNVYVADSGNHRIKVFKPDGTYLSKFETTGSVPRGIAFDANNKLYVVDSGNHRISIFDTQGVLQSQFGTAGTGNKQFQYPEGVAIDSFGRIYVADTGNHRVQFFSSAQNYLGEFGGFGTLNGKFDYPKSVAIAPNNNIYVTDANNQRIQVFGQLGNHLQSFGSAGSGIGQFSSAQSIAIAPDFKTYVADGGNHRIQVFNAANTFTSSFSYDNQWIDATFNYPHSLAVSPLNQFVYVTDTRNHRIKVFDAAGVYKFQFGKRGQDAGEFYYPDAIAAAPNGVIYVADGNNRIQVFNDLGVYQFEFGWSGIGIGEFTAIHGLTVSNDGKVYVTDFYRIQVFELDGTPSNITFGTQGQAHGQFSNPFGIAIGPDDKLYIADSNNNRIEIYTRNGQYIGTIGSTHGDSQLKSPRGIALDAAGNVYVADSGNHRIAIFDSTGNFVTKVGVPGTGNSAFNNIQGLALMPNTDIYVTDTDNQRIQVFRTTTQNNGGTTGNTTGGTSGTGGGTSGGGLGAIKLCTDVIALNHGSPIPCTYPPSTVAINTNDTNEPNESLPPDDENQNPITPDQRPRSETRTILTSIIPQPVRNIITATGKAISGQILEPTRITIEKIDRATPVPIKTTVPRAITMSGLLIGSVAMITDNFFAAPITFPQILLFPSRLFANILTMLGIRKRRRPWGTVYDSISKQPVDPIHLELVDPEGRIAAKTITDFYGRYSFNVEPGHYMLRPVKTGFIFPSFILAHTNRDEIYRDLYFGNFFEIKNKGELISKNIPMDRTNFNWPEFFQEEQKLLNAYARRDFFVSKLSRILFVAGFVVAALSLLLAPRSYTVIVFALYLFMYVMNKAGINPSKLGQVVEEESKSPLSFAVIRLFSLNLGNEVIRKVTNKYGQFYCPVPNGKYYLSYDRKNPNGTYTEAENKEYVEVKRGVVSGHFEARF